MKFQIRDALAIALSLFMPVQVFGQASSNPEALVRAIIERDRDAKLISMLPSRPDKYMKSQFTKAFNDSWTNAMSRGQDEPVIDGDIITGRQTVTHVTLKSSAKAENGDFAMISTNIIYIDEDGPKKPHSVVVRFFLKKEDGIWKIDDINAGDLDSIRTSFRKSYGK